MIINEITNALFHRCFGKGRMRDKSTQSAARKLLRFESLENRELLSVTPVEYDQIRSSYSDIDLPQSYESTTFLEVSDLTQVNLQNAINQAANSDSSCVILLRGTSSGKNTLTSTGEAFIVNALSNNTVITVLGDLNTNFKFELAEKQEHLFDVSSGRLQLGNIAVTNIATSDETNVVLFGVVTPENDWHDRTITGEDVLFFDQDSNELTDGSIASYTIIDPSLDPLWKNPESNAPNMSNNYVVIFSGGGSPGSNHDRYYNNVKSLYNVVTVDYNIPKENVYVIYADGTSSKVDRSSKLDSDMSFAKGSSIYAANVNNLSTVMTTISNKMTDDSHFLFYSFDHGAEADSGKEYLVTYTTGSLYYEDCVSDTQFATEMFKIKKGYCTIVATQCFAGGMIDNVIVPTSGEVRNGYTGNAKFYCLSATNHAEPSWGDAFSAAFINAIRKGSGGAGLITTDKVFSYAKRNDSYAATSTYNNNEGSVIVGLEHPWGAGKSFSIFSTNSPIKRSDLIPYKPSSWSDKIVVGNTSTATMTTSSLGTNDNIYVNWAVDNNSDVDITTAFKIKLTLTKSNTIIKSQEYEIESLAAGYYVYTDTNSTWNIGKLEAGTYIVTLEADSGGKITESNESNNTYTTSFKVSQSGQADLTYTKPSGYADALIVSSRASSTQNASILTTENNIYASFGVKNQGTISAGVFQSTVTLSGKNLSSPISKTVTCSSLSAGSSQGYTISESFGKLKSGTYTLTLKIDTATSSSARVSESQENNNTYSIDFIVYNPNYEISIPASSGTTELLLADYLPYNVSGTWTLSKVTAGTGVTKAIYTQKSSGQTTDLVSSSKVVSGTLGFDTVSFTRSQNDTTSTRSTSLVVENGDAKFTWKLVQEKGTKDDDYEDNDSITTATVLGTLKTGKTLSGLILKANDEDWFSFAISDTGSDSSYVMANYSHIANFQDMDIELYSSVSSTSPILYSRGNTGTERFSLEGLSAGTYYIRVFNRFENYTIPNYTLTINPTVRIAQPQDSLTVTSSSDDNSAGTLRYVLQNAEEGATIKFSDSLKGATITLNSALNINKSVTIDASACGTNKPGITYSIDAGDKLIYINSNTSISDAGIVKLVNLNLFGTGSTNSGYGVFIRGGSGTQVFIDDCIISDFGTAIYNISSCMSVTNTTLKHNSYALYNYDMTNEVRSITTLTHCVFTENKDAITNGRNAAIDISESEITDNSRYAIINMGTGNITVRGCTIAGNVRGVALAGGNAVFNNSIVVNNGDPLAEDESNRIYNIRVGASTTEQSITAVNVLTTEDLPWTTCIDLVVYNPDAPLFTDTVHGDYSLADGSQARCLGNALFSIDCYENAITKDIIGNDRITGANSLDIGAYQYTVTASLDIDNDGVFDSKDVTLLKRYVLKYKADTIVGSLKLTGTRNTGQAIYDYITANIDQFNIDGDYKNGVSVFGTKDITLIKRYELGYGEDTVTGNVSLTGFMKDSKSIYDYLSRLDPKNSVNAGNRLTVPNPVQASMPELKSEKLYIESQSVREEPLLPLAHNLQCDTEQREYVFDLLLGQPEVKRQSIFAAQPQEQIPVVGEAEGFWSEPELALDEVVETLALNTYSNHLTDVSEEEISSSVHDDDWFGDYLKEDQFDIDLATCL